MPIGVATLIELIADIEPILNCTLTVPFIDLFNCILLIVTDLILSILRLLKEDL